jgi:hypothetical protein
MGIMINKSEIPKLKGNFRVGVEGLEEFRVEGLGV